VTGGEPENERIGQLMSPERWNKLETVFDAALAFEPAEQKKFLKQECADDEALQRELESLLAADMIPDAQLSHEDFELYMKVMADTLRDEEKPAFETEITVGMKIDNHWKILERLDGGGMGDVYKALDLRFPGRIVVVKVLKKDSQENSWKIKKFGHEGLAQSRIQHANVATVFDRGTLPSGEQYLVMEFIKGATLQQVIKDHKQDDRQIELSLVAEIMKQLSAGVAAIHEAGLVHRDLKPLNIMIQPNTDGILVKIIDFGIVRVLDTSTMWGQVVGSLFYMSPEQLRGEDPKFPSDIYALAVIAYELLTGRRPFEPQNAAQLLELQKKGVKRKPSALRDDLPQEAERLILKALSFEANKRPSLAREFGNALAKALLEVKPVRPWWSSVEVRVAALILSAALIGMFLWFFWPLAKSNNPNTTAQPAAAAEIKSERALNYSLTIVRKRDGKTTLATGRETFDTGDEFRFSFDPLQAGALYVFNEGNSGNWHLLFPTPNNHQGNPQLAALERIETEGYEFTNRTGSEKGTERIWIVWAAGTIPTLDEVVKQAIKNDLSISNSGQRLTLQQFMFKYQTPPPDVKFDTEKSQVTLRGRTDAIVYLLELENKDWK
jgi:serine/threonine protein kinase